MSVSASAACGTCKKQKKKCDKKLPNCSRCLLFRVLRECKYEDKAAMPVVTLGHSKLAPYELTLAHPHLLPHCSDVDYYILHNTAIQNGASELHVATVNYVLKLLSSSGASIQSMLSDYLRTIGTWLPVISRKRLYQGVSCMVAKPRADFALLLLSINLVLQPSTYHLEALCSRNPAYYRVKQLFGLLQSANIRSVDMVQSGLLITTYEYGHGCFESAFLSIGICARMAHILGWHEKNVSPDEACREEEIRVWWGIRAFERILDLDSNFSSAILIPDMNMSLPTEDEEWDLPPDGLSTESPFPQTALLQAQGARLLGRAIGLTVNPPLSIENRSQYDNKLKSTLVQFAIAVSDCSREEWGANCGALGLAYSNRTLHHSNTAYSAIYHLHLTPYNEDSDLKDENSVFELRRTTRIVVDIARTFHLWCLSNKNEINPGRCLPLTLHALRQACLTHIKLARAEFRSYEWEGDLDALKNMLVFIRRRWALAGKILSDIQDAYDKKVEELN